MLPPKPRAQVEAQCAKAARILQGGRERTAATTAAQNLLVLSGVHDALTWVLGLTPWAPLSGRDLPDPGPRELFGEWARAEAVRHRSRVLPEGMDQAYVSGIELALAWARGSSDAAPPAD
jgi:hypothetical protein